MTCTKTILVNMDNKSSILKAERMKSSLERKGFDLTKTSHIGFSKFRLDYKKVRK